MCKLIISLVILLSFCLGSVSAILSIYYLWNWWHYSATFKKSKGVKGIYAGDLTENDE